MDADLNPQPTAKKVTQAVKKESLQIKAHIPAPVEVEIPFGKL